MRSLGAIVSTGMRTGIGLDAQATAFLLRTGVPALGPAPLAGSDGAAVTMAFDRTLDPYLCGEERAARLGAAAASEVLAVIPSQTARALRVRVALAFPEPRPGQSRSEAGQVLATEFRSVLRERLGSPDVELTAQGAAGAAYVLPGALAALAAGEVDAVLAGGLHTDYDPAAIAALAATGRLFGPDCIDAVLPGEAAAFVLVVRDDTASRLGLTPLARIFGVGSDTADVVDAEARSFDARSLTRAIRRATQTMPEELEIGWAIADLGLEHARARELYAALTKAHRRFGPPLFVDAPAQRAGHLGAAALPLGIGYMALAHRHGFAPAPLGLVLAASDGGERGAVLVGSP